MNHTPARLVFAAALVSLAVATASSSATAQRCVYVPSDTPQAGVCNSFPWNVNSSRYQTLVTAADLGTSVNILRSLAFAPCSSATFTASSITIRFAYFQGATLSTNFANNLGNASVTMLQKQNFSWNFTAGQWNDIGLTGVFPYTPSRGNLLIDIQFEGAMGSSSFRRDTRQRVYANNWAGPTPPATGTSNNGALKMRVGDGVACATGSFTPYGTGCGRGPLKIVGLGTPRLGQQVQIALGQGASSSVGAYLVGLQRQSIPLDSAGMTGCTLYTDIVDVVGTSFNIAGQATPITLQIPSNASLVGLKITYSGFNIDSSANARGISTADGLEMLIGS